MFKTAAKVAALFGLLPRYSDTELRDMEESEGFGSLANMIYVRDIGAGNTNTFTDFRLSKNDFILSHTVQGGWVEVRFLPNVKGQYISINIVQNNSEGGRSILKQVEFELRSKSVQTNTSDLPVNDESLTKMKEIILGIEEFVNIVRASSDNELKALII